MTPNPDLLRIEFLGITAHHDEVEMPREDLALFFAGLSGPYGLSRLEYHSDAGATFSGPDGAECVLRPGQIASCGVTSLGYREGLGRVIGERDVRNGHANRQEVNAVPDQARLAGQRLACRRYADCEIVLLRQAMQQHLVGGKENRIGRSPQSVRGLTNSS